MNNYCIIKDYRLYRPLCRLLAKEVERVAMLWPALIVTWHAHAAGIKERVRTPVSKNLILNVLSAVNCSFSPEQRLQLATPSYKIKKDKREAKKLESTPSKDTDSLVEPSAVTVLGAVDKQGTVKSPPSVAPPEKKVKKDKTATSKTVKSTTSSSTVDSKLAKLDEYWSDRFNRLEAILLARSIEPTFLLC